MNKTLGRTNAAFPDVWLSLSTQESGAEGWHSGLVQAALEAKTVIDISSSPILWGGQMRGTDAQLMTIGGRELANATDSDHAGDLLQAHLLQTLSSVGREMIDFYFLDYRRAWEEHQINGALETLEYAKQEGAIKYIGLYAGGSSLAALGLWQFHDGFDVILCPHNPVQADGYKTLAPLAHERRVGLVGSSSLNWGSGIPITELASKVGLSADEIAKIAIRQASRDHPLLVGVKSESEVLTAAAPGLQDESDIEVLEKIKTIVESGEIWKEFRNDDRKWVQAAAQKALSLQA